MTYQSEVLADTPRQYLRLGESSGTTAVDSSGNGFNYTYQGTFTLGVAGALSGDADTAVNLSPTTVTGYLTDGLIRFQPGTGPFTIEAWVKRNASGSGRIFWAKASADFLILDVESDGTLTLTLGTSSVATAAGAVGSGAYHHVVVTCAGASGAVSYYVDGVLFDTDTAPAYTFGTPTESEFIGGFFISGNSPSFNGTIDEVALYYSALSSTRVGVHYATGAATDATASPAAVVATVTMGVPTGGSIANAEPAAVVTTATVVTPAGSASATPAAIVATASVPTVTSPITLALLDGTAGALTFPLTLAEPTIPLPTPAGQATRWQVLAVDRFGVIYAEYPTAKVKPIVWTKNMPETGGARIPIDALDLDEMPLANEDTTPHREMQIWRNGHLLLWCVPTGQQADSTDRVWDYSCKGLLWYLTRRKVDGGANRHNFLTDGSFETAGLPDWPVEGAGITQSQDVVHRVFGPNSMRLDQTTAALDAFAHQANLIASTHVGLALFLTAWVWVQTFTAPAYGNRGVYIERSGTGIFVNYEIVATTPTQTLLRASKSIQLPPDVNEIVDVRMYPPQGTAYFDAVTLTAEESLSMIAVNSPTGDGWDQIDMARYILDLVQGRGAIANAWPEGNGKSDLNFGFAGAPSPVLKERTWQFMDHQRAYIGPQGNGVLDEFLKADDGFDISIVTTPTTRTFTTWYPRIGTDRTDLELRYVKDPTNPARDVKYGIVGWTFAKNIEQAGNDIVILGGWGSGAGREEGGYHDPGTLGGLTLELVESAPQGTPIDALNSFAAARCAQLSSAVQTPNLILAEPRHPVTNEVTYPLIGILLPGDRVPIHVDDGNVQMDGTYEIVRVELDPDTDLLHVTVNPVAA